MTDPATLLNTPPGLPGSGRVRYGAAMALWRAGALSAEVLELYRIAAAHDARDLTGELRACGGVVLPDASPSSAMRQLYDVARGHLLAQRHPGAAELRVALPSDPGEQRALPARMTGVVGRWLSRALSLVEGQGGLADCLARAAGDLRWRVWGQMCGTPSGLAFAPILGAAAPFGRVGAELGLFLLAPDQLCRDHHHPAARLLVPLSAPLGWRLGPERRLAVIPPHQPLWTPSHQPLLIKAGRAPCLGLYLWAGAVTGQATIIPAPDWQRLQEVQIG